MTWATWCGVSATDTPRTALEMHFGTGHLEGNTYELNLGSLRIRIGTWRAPNRRYTPCPR